MSLAGLGWVVLYSSPGTAPAPAGAAFLYDITHLNNAALAAFGLLLAGGYIWRWALDDHIIEIDRVYNRFALIVGTYLAYLPLAWLFGAAFLPTVIIGDAFWVFVVGLGAIALARSRLEAASHRQSLGGRWFLLALGVIAGLLALGLLIGTGFSHEVGEALFAPVLGAAEAVGLLVVLIVGAIGSLAALVFQLLFGWVPQAKPPPPPTVTPQDPAAGFADLAHKIEAAPHPDNSFLVGALGLAVLALIVGLIIYRVLRDARARQRTLESGERESIFDWAAVLQSLRRARPAQGVAVRDSLLALEGDPAYRYTMRVRRAYRRALARGAAVGMMRLPAQTPDEVLPTLQRAFPAARAPLAHLTALYNATRYTATPADAATAEAAERDLAALTEHPHES